MLTTLMVLLQAESNPAAPGTEAQPPAWLSYLPMVAIALVFWFVLIQPERKNRKKREAMLAALQKGDKVMTSSGLHGVVAAIQDDTVMLQVDEGVRLKFARSAIQLIESDSSATPAKS